MIELPEAATLAAQFEMKLLGKTIASVTAAHTPHGFAFYNGEPTAYSILLQDRKVTGAAAYGGRPEIRLEDMRLSFGDGVNIRYLKANAPEPSKHQLYIRFTDQSALYCTLSMYGGMWAFPEDMDQGFYYNVAKEKPSPLTDAFNESYFAALFSDQTMKLSAKAFLATEQRIPGLGNGVLQDILFNCSIHPKRKMATLTDAQTESMFRAIKHTLKRMTNQGGRDTEKDFLGQAGGYQTILSKKTLDTPCPRCGAMIVRSSYLGGNIYFCEQDTCQGKY